MNGRSPRRRWALALVVVALASLLFHTPTAAAADAPTAPGNLRVVSVEPFSVQLAWDASTGGQVNPWDDLLYGVWDETGQHGAWFYNGETSGFITGLEPGTTYTFTAKARDNAWQTSPDSNPVTVTTEEIEPLPVPTNIRVTENVTGTEIAGEFDVAEDPRVVGYGVRVVSEGRTAHAFTVGDTTTFKAENMVPEAEYEITVNAVMESRQGTFGGGRFTGEPSEPFHFTTSRDTVAPRTPETLEILDRTGTSVSLQWARSGDKVGVTDYVLSNGETTQTVPASSVPNWGPIPGTFTNLDPETTYTFTVRARDAAGNLSDASPAQTIATGVDPDVDPPAPVTGLQGTNDQFGTFITWNASTDNVTLQRALKYQLTTDGGDEVTLTGGTQFFASFDVGGVPLRGCEATVVVIDGAGNRSEPRSTQLC